MIKKHFKKALALTMTAAMMAAGMPAIGELAVVEAAISDSSNVEVMSTCNTRYTYDTVVKYTAGRDVQTDGIYIAITYNADYNSSNANAINETTIKTVNRGSKGIVYTSGKLSTADGEKYITVGDLGTTKEGDYTVWYMVGSSLNSSSFTLVKGPVINAANFKTFGNGFEMRFKNDNEYVSYTWTVYDKLPTDTTASTPDSNSGSGIENNTEITISSNSLEKNKTYYLVLEVTGDTSGAKCCYGSGSNKYYQFHTNNDDTTASGDNTQGSSSSSSSSSSSGTAKPTKVTNSDGSVTETSITNQGTVKTKNVETTWYTDKAKTTKDRIHTINTVTDSTTGETKMRDTDKQGDGSYIETYIAVQKDKSYYIESTEATASGTKSVTAATYSAAGKITAVAERTLNKNNETTFETNYKIGSGNKLTVSKITSSKATLDISDLVTVSVLKNYKDTTGIETSEKEYSVTAIGDKVLKGNKKVKKITINSDIKTIGKNAFAKAKNLKSIEIAGPLTKVGKGAFTGISSKATITVIASKAKFNSTKKLLKKAGVAKTVNIKRA